MNGRLYFILSFLLFSLSLQAQVTLIPYKSSWKYLDDGTDQGTAWRSPAYSDADWSTGTGKLGYGLSGLGTTTGTDSSRKNPTTYFRKTFFLDNPSLLDDLSAKAAFNDGLVVYVNGVEVYRKYLPSGTISFATPASAAYNGSKSFTIRKNLLVPGENLLAVEVHQSPASPADLAFDLRLLAAPDTTAPKVLSSVPIATPPSPGKAAALAFRLTFSEAVTGVDAGDFTLTPASGNPGGTISTVTPAPDGRTFDVAVSSLTGAGTLRLDVNSGGTGITDVNGIAFSGGYTSGQAYTVDVAFPYVVSISRLPTAAEVTKSSSLKFLVVFSEKVKGVGVDDFSVVSLNGTATGIIESGDVDAVDDRRTTYEVKVSSVSGNGQLRLDLKDSETGIVDAAGNPCGGYSAGQAYRVDKTKPLVAAVERYLPAAAGTNAASVVFRTTFNEGVKGVDAADFSLSTLSGNVTGVLAADAVTSIGTDGSTYAVRVSDLAGQGQLRLKVKSGSSTGITDLAGNSLSGGFSTGESYTRDPLVPVVVSVNRQLPAAAATHATELTWRVTFSKPVTEVTPACFSLQGGSATGTLADGAVAPVGTAGTTYDVRVRSVSGTGSLRLDLPGGTSIRDNAGNNLGEGFTAGQAYTVDQAPPAVVGVERLEPLAEGAFASSLVWRVTFSEKVLGVAPADFQLTALSGPLSGRLAADAVTAVGTEGTTYDVRVVGLTQNASLRLDVRPGAGLADAAGNRLAQGYAAGASYKVDPPPVLVSSHRLLPATERTSADRVTFRVTFSEWVTGVDASSFVLSALSGTPGGVVETVAPADAAGTVYDVTVTGIGGTGVVRLELKSGGTGITDAAGSAPGAGSNGSTEGAPRDLSGSETYTIDKSGPLVAGIHRLSPAAPASNGSEVVYRVVFAEAVTGVDPSDFLLTTVSGTTTGTVAPEGVQAVGSEGTTFDVAVNGIGGTGSLRLDLSGSGTGISDLLGNEATTGFTQGETYRFDYTAPVATAISRLKPYQEKADGGAATYRVTFSEAVTGVDPSDFTLTPLSGTPSGRLAPDAVVAADSTGTSWEVTLTDISTFVTLRLDLNPAGTGIADSAGNLLEGGFTAGQRYIMDPPPAVVSISRQSPLSETTGEPEVTFRVVFSEKVRNVDASDFYTTTLSGEVRGTLAALSNTVMASSTLTTVAAVGTAGTTYDVTVRAIAGNGTLRLDLKDQQTDIKDSDGLFLSSGFTGGETYSFQQPTEGRFASVTDLAPVTIEKNTGEKPQGKVWTYAGKWWSVLATPGGTKLFRLDGTAWTEVLLLSEVEEVHADCRVVGNVTHILLFEPEEDSYLVSVEFDETLGTYKRWSQRPSAVEVPFGSGAETATLAVDGTGRMWIAAPAKTDVNVRWSDAPYTRWSDTIRIAEGILDDDICALTPVPGGVGLLWSNQNSQRFGFRVHQDGDDPRNWSADEAPAAASAQARGHGFADDHLNVLCASDGTLYCAVKTSYDTPGYPKLSLLVRRPAAGWSFHPVTSVEGTRGVVVLNEATGKLKVVYCTMETGGDIVYRETSTASIAFGAPKTLISGPFLFNEATTTHQPTTGEVVILATNQDPDPKQAVGVIARDEEGQALPALTAAPPAQELSGTTAKSEIPSGGWAATLELFPNPVAATATVRFRLPQEAAYHLVLYDARGTRLKEVKSGRAPAGQAQAVGIDASRLPAGVYLLRLQTAGGSKTLRLIVEK
ncbi:T9SS type A sorting domain-containing protein [Paraflavisolibacter sp. H34]|uniref:T9SS type A sorting domain-containing protein n=1 Tax=Huijunlia imazamoxiresistens TaxID=3127457 RepID=UPI00301A6918